MIQADESLFKSGAFRRRSGSLTSDAMKLETGRKKPVSVRLSFGVEAIDGALGGGLNTGSVHQIVPDRHEGARLGFALALVGRIIIVRPKPILWIRQRYHGRAEPYPLARAQQEILNRSPVILVDTANRLDFAWAVEEALRDASVGTVLAQGDIGKPLVGRRWQLAAEESGNIGIFLPDESGGGGWAAATQWRVRSLPSDLGTARWWVTLERCRLPGGWTSWRPDQAWEVGWDEAQLRFHLHAVL